MYAYIYVNVLDAINNRTNGQTHRAACAVVGDLWNMCFGIKSNGLITRIIAGHVTFSTVYTHILKKKISNDHSISNMLLFC